MIDYRIGNDLNLDAVIDLYRASTLGERRPVDDPERMAAMLRNANLVVTAWDGELLVGIARSLTDFTYADVSFRPCSADLPSAARYWQGVDSSHPATGGARYAHRAAGGSGRGGLLPECRLHAAYERLDSGARGGCAVGAGGCAAMLEALTAHEFV